MVNSSDLVISLSKCDKHDTKFIGGKGANLGEMIDAGFPVPGGFVITSSAYFQFIKDNKLDIKIKHLLGTVNFDSTDSLAQVSRHIRTMIKSAPVGESLVKDIFQHYEKIGSPLVAVRSSATSEDSKDASFAGQQETFLNVLGESVLVEKVRDAWASLFGARAIYYRHEAKLDHVKNGIAVVVQKMVQSDTSGIMFTIDPVTQNKERIVIDAIYGLGEYIVQGKVIPDHYEVDKSTLTIVSKEIGLQEVKLIKKLHENKEERVLKSEAEKQKIKDADILGLAKLGLELERHYYFPQDIEWAQEKGKLYVVQTRPITTIKDVEKVSKVTPLKPVKLGDPMLIGSPASPGIGIGEVKIIHKLSESSSFKPGMILVTKATNPDFVPIMKKAAAIITQEGGRTSHAAIVSREYGIPAIVGVHLALEKLQDGMIVTVNGAAGTVYKGSLKISQTVETHPDIKTATKLYVNLAEPELASKISALPVDGVGLLRAEFMIAQIGVHPKKMIEDGKGSDFTNRLADDLSVFCKSFYPRPVLYRATDFKTNEYKSLTGGKKYEPDESNPMLGYRGAYRYMHDPRVFKLELAAIKKVREKMGLTNLRLMLPFVRTVNELNQVKKIIHEEGLRRSHTFKLFMMVEIPSNVILIQDFIDAGIDGVSIGSNDLTMLTLGVDRDNEEVSVEFNEQNAALMWSFERVIKAARDTGIEVGICGQAPSEYPELVEKLVAWGINSISVSPDAIDKTRLIISQVEKKLVRQLQGK